MLSEKQTVIRAQRTSVRREYQRKTHRVCKRKTSLVSFASVRARAWATLHGLAVVWAARRVAPYQHKGIDAELVVTLLVVKQDSVLRDGRSHFWRTGERTHKGSCVFQTPCAVVRRGEWGIWGGMTFAWCFVHHIFRAVYVLGLCVCISIY